MQIWQMADNIYNEEEAEGEQADWTKGLKIEIETPI
jgi:hypothetical protein